MALFRKKAKDEIVEKKPNPAKDVATKMNEEAVADLCNLEQIIKDSNAENVYNMIKYMILHGDEEKEGIPVKVAYHMMKAAKEFITNQGKKMYSEEQPKSWLDRI